MCLEEQGFYKLCMHTIKTDNHIYAKPQNSQAQRFELKMCIYRNIWIIADNGFPKIPEMFLVWSASQDLICGLCDRDVLQF